MYSLTERFHEVLRQGTGSLQALQDLHSICKQERTLEIVDGCELFLQPSFLNAAEKTRLEHDTAQLFDLMMSVPARLFDRNAAAMCDVVGIGAIEKAAVLATWADQDVLMGRADLFKTAQGFKLLEFNVHSSTGGLENADLNRAMLRVPFLRDFIDVEGLAFTDTLDGVAEALWDAARKRGLPNQPSVAICDWHTTFDQYTRSLTRIGRALSNRGFDAFACSLRDITLKNGKLFVGSRPVDILYRIFLIDDVAESPQDIAPILSAHQSGTVLLAMSFVAELVGNKGTLALLSDPINSNHFTTEERDLIERYIPWTRFLETGKTEWQGQRCDILALAVEMREELVLKPTIGYAGHGVLTGWSTPENVWRHEIERAAGDTVSRYVIQERVRPVTDVMARLTPDSLEWQEIALNWGIYVANSRFNGVLIRGAEATNLSVINVAQGASMGCCFHGA